MQVANLVRQSVHYHVLCFNLITPYWAIWVRGCTTACRFNVVWWLLSHFLKCSKSAGWISRMTTISPLLRQKCSNKKLSGTKLIRQNCVDYLIWCKGKWTLAVSSLLFRADFRVDLLSSLVVQNDWPTYLVLCYIMCIFV